MANAKMDETFLRRVLSVTGRFGTGGLHGLRAAFAEHHEEAVFDSWVGIGANAATTAAVIRAALGERLDLLARASGHPPETLAEELAVLLPRLVDELTPNGVLPEPRAGLWSRWRNALRGQL